MLHTNKIFTYLQNNTKNDPYTTHNILFKQQNLLTLSLMWPTIFLTFFSEKYVVFEVGVRAEQTWQHQMSEV